MNPYRFLATVLVASALVAGATGQETRIAKAPPAEPPTVRRALVICGLPGDGEHRTAYADAVEAIVRGLVARCGFAAEEVWVRFGTEVQSGDGPALKRSRGLSTREGLAADVAELRKATSADDGLWVIVLGHGHLDGRRSHLNLPGPDLSDVEFGKLFAGIAAREQVFLLTTSASGFFVKPLAAPGRIAVSATEADQEVNETLFPLALADVLTSPPEGIDRDKDGAISVLELYLAVVADVRQRYVIDENIATEHAQLDDNGDGHGSEVQTLFLPPEYEDPAETKDEPKAKTEAQAKAKAAPVEPKTLGSKDDGYLASRVRLGRPKAEPAAPQS